MYFRTGLFSVFSLLGQLSCHLLSRYHLPTVDNSASRLVADTLHLELCLALALCNDNKALGKRILLDFYSVPGDEICDAIAANADCQTQVRTVSLGTDRKSVV